MNKTNHKSKKVASIRLTLLQASEEFGVTRETLRRAIKTSPDFTPKPDGKFTLREIHALLSGDIRVERARLTKAKASREELELKKASGDLVPAELFLRNIRETMLPVRQRLFAMPSELAVNANSLDPQQARVAAQQWLDINLPIMQSGTLPDECPCCGQKNPKQKKETSVDNEQ